jgi:hypothetical protein
VFAAGVRPRRGAGYGAGVPSHPLDADVAALRGAGFLRLERAPAGPGWLRCADLVAGPDALDAWTGRVAGWLRRTHGAEPHPSVAPTYLMGWYLDALARTGATWVVRRGRLPDLDPDDLALHETPGGWPDAVAVGGSRFRCLPDDPMAAHPDAVVVADTDDLLAALDARVREHAAAFHHAFRPPVAIGSRQRWGMVDDVLEACLWSARRDAGVPAGRLGTRRSCCFAYRVDPVLLCHRCPRRT